MTRTASVRHSMSTFRPTQPLTLAASAVATLVCMVWGGNVVAVRLSLLELPPFAAAATRSALAALLLFGWAATSSASLRPQLHTLRPLLLLSALTVGIVASYYLAVSRTSASHAAILVYAHPLFTALLAHRCISGEYLDARKVLGLSLGFLGTGLTLHANGTGAGAPAVGGDLLALLSAAIWAVYTVETKRSAITIPVLHLAFYPTAVAAVAFTAISALLEHPRSLSPSAPALWALAYQGCLATAGGNVVWFLLLARYPASALSGYTFLTPLFGVVASAVVLDDALSFELLLALGLILAGLRRLSPTRSVTPSFPPRRARGDVALHD